MINDQPVTEMPTHCVRDECRRTASGGKLQSRKGFMVCDECGSSYGAAPADPGDDLLGDHLIAEAEREQASTPAEQLSGKVETTFAWLAEHRPPGATREPCYGGEDANGVAFHTADHNAAKRFPTKAAAEAWITERIPREGFKAVEHGWFGSPAEQPGKAADPRPAQPQAPAEPTPEQIETARKLAMKIFAFHNSGNADLGKETAWIEAHAEHVAAPLREERDRLRKRIATLMKALNPGSKLHGLVVGGSIKADAVSLYSPTQPDARDAEIARLREELEAWKLAKGAGRMQAENARLAKEPEEAREETRLMGEPELTGKGALMLNDHAIRRADAAEAQAKALREALLSQKPKDSQLGGPCFCRTLDNIYCVGQDRCREARRALAPPEPKAETPAETQAKAKTAGQKEGAKPLVYLACPYSHADREVRAARWALANYAAGELMAKGEKVFSPISHTHPIAEAHDLPLGWDFWEAFDRAYIGHSHKLIVLMLDGWMESKGVQAEIAIAQEMGIPVEYMDPPAPTSPSAAQPSQDAAGTSSESLLSTEKP